MKKIGLFLAVLAGVVTLTSSANASNCKSIADSMQRLACYDKADSAPAPSRKSATVNLFDAAPTAILTKPGARVLTPVEPRPSLVDSGRWRNLWIFQKFADHRDDRTARFNRPNPHSNLTWVHRADHDIDGSNPIATAASAVFGGGGNLRVGLLAGLARTIAIEGSAFYVQGSSGSISEAPTTARTSTFVNTTPDVFVGLFDDTTTTSVTNAVISDQFYGADANFRMRTPLFASLPNFDVMFGLRYAALSERLTADVNSVSSHIFQPDSACRRRSISPIPQPVPARSRFAMTSSGHSLVQRRKALGALLGRE